MMNKKASMELGISTVVVLVIAMVIIAGGIAFIRGFFKQGTDKLGGAFEIADFGVEPTAMDPLVLVEGAPTIKSGNQEKIRVAYYNTRSSKESVMINISQCASAVSKPSGCNNIIPTVTSLTQDVEPGQAKGFETYITASCVGAGKPLQKGEYICTLIATKDGSAAEKVEEKQITLTVES